MTFDPRVDAADVAVIGGGAAGLLAGISAARAGATAVVYERMPTPGRKIAIAGGGRCNFTNTLNPRDFVRRFGDANATKLGHALRAFSSSELIALLERHGVEGQVEKGYRLFTKSGRGGDVVRAFVEELKEAGGVLECGARIAGVTRGEGFVLEGTFSHVEERRTARTVIIASGGMSYPLTGSSGDGYAFARALGHTVTPLRAALVGLTVEEDWPADLQGLAWPDAEVTLTPCEIGEQTSPQVLTAERGEILCTHFGISGPAILDISNVYVFSGLELATLTIDFFPSIKRAELDQQVLACFKRSPGRMLANALAGFKGIPARLMDYWQYELGPDGAQPVGRFPKEARQKLLDLFKETTLTVTGTRGVQHGEVTAGGVSWDEIDAATLQSKLCPGLYFAGEILDITGRCGGFNLQAAFSTGFLAGQSAAQITSHRRDAEGAEKGSGSRD